MRVLPSINWVFCYETFSNLPYYCTSASTIQMSKLYSYALNQYVTRFFNLAKSSSSKSAGHYLPQFRTLEKSFPVPRGNMAIGTFMWSISCLWSSLTTHMTVPSPPQMTKMTLAFYLTKPFSSWNPLSFFSLFLRSKRWRLMVTIFLRSEGYCEAGTSKTRNYFWMNEVFTLSAMRSLPIPPPDPELMNMKT